MNAVIVPKITLKSKEKTNIIPVFLKPNNKYLSVKTSLKLSNVILSQPGKLKGEVITISAFVFKAANRVSRIGAITMATMPRHRICFKV